MEKLNLYGCIGSIMLFIEDATFFPNLENMIRDHAQTFDLREPFFGDLLPETYKKKHCTLTLFNKFKCFHLKNLYTYGTNLISWNIKINKIITVFNMINLTNKT